MNEQQRAIATAMDILELTATKQVAHAACRFIDKALSDENPSQSAYMDKASTWLACITALLGETPITLDALPQIHEELESMWNVKVFEEANQRGLTLPEQLLKRVTQP